MGRGVRLVFSVGAVLGWTACAPADRDPAPDDAPPAEDAPADRVRATADVRDSIRFVDAAGRRHALGAPAARIVSLVPSATETLHTLGASDVVVGVTDYDEGWADSLPSVGGGLEPNLEALVALQPDAVIRFEGEQDPRTPIRLDELGIRHVGVRPVALDDIYETNRIVGALVGKEVAADSLSEAIREGLAEVAEAVTELPRLRVVYILGGSPPWVAGPETYIAEILSLVGGDNAFDDLDAPYRAVSPEELRARDIDVVLVSDLGSFDRTLAPDSRIESMGDLLEAPGPAVVAEARAVAELVHGRRIRSGPSTAHELPTGHGSTSR